MIDEKSGQPVPAAAVVILWQRLDDQVQDLRRLAAAQEAFTNERGEFVHDVRALEGRLPPRTFAPRIIIFRPGYVPVPGKPQLFPPGVPASGFTGAGSPVKLTPVGDYEDRAEAFNTFIAMLSASQLFPPTELPETWDLIRFELESLGARPPKPPAPGGAEMTFRLRVAALSMCLVAVASMARGQNPEGWDRYLDRYRGPYQGRVIDADTKAPLVGAVFVALWRLDRTYPLHIVTENYAVRETVTDPNGQFLLHARDVEEGAPRRTRRPEFLIFVPGYGSFPSFQKAPTGFLGDVFEGLGTTVELPRLGGREERRKHLLRIGPHSLSETPFKDLPQLMRNINDESISIGISPYLPQEK